MSAFHHPYLVLTALVFACTTPEPTHDPVTWDLEHASDDFFAAQDTPPPVVTTPGPPMFLDASALVPGQPFDLFVEGALPNALVRFGVSPAGLGPGPCPANLGGLCAEIPLPILEIGRARADGAGFAALSTVAPLNLPALGQGGFQAFSFGRNPQTSNPLLRQVQPFIDPAWFVDFAGPDPILATEAYEGLYRAGPYVIPVLFDFLGSLQPYVGGGYDNPLSSVSNMEPPTVNLTAMYLIDAILRDTQAPHYAVRLISPDASLPPDLLEQIAIDGYFTWLTDFGFLPPQDLVLAPTPIEYAVGLGLLPPMAWFGPVVPIANPPPNGTAVPGSSTPTTSPAVCLSNPDGPDAGTTPDDYAWVLRPGVAGGPTPYNCFAWSMACSDDRWIQPTATKTVSDILTDYGYDAANTVACAGQCPPGKGPKVMMVHHVPTGGTAGSGNWVHAMKQEADGDWTSKNGSSSQYSDITDGPGFADTHYPAPAGTTSVKQCYCKP